MAPVEIDHIPRSFSIENLNLKSVEKALELPLVNSAYTEVTRMASPITPYVESTLTKVTPRPVARPSRPRWRRVWSRTSPPTSASPSVRT